MRWHHTQLTQENPASLCSLELAESSKLISGGGFHMRAPWERSYLGRQGGFALAGETPTLLKKITGK